MRLNNVTLEKVKGFGVAKWTNKQRTIRCPICSKELFPINHPLPDLAQLVECIPRYWVKINSRHYKVLCVYCADIYFLNPLAYED